MGMIRLFLALSVVFVHLGLNTPGLKTLGQELPVQMFFVISGFYMSLVLNEKYLPKPGIYWVFIKNRILRLYPSYAVVGILSLIFGFVMMKLGHPSDFYQIWNNQPVSISLSSKIFSVITAFTVIGQDLTLFFAIDHSGNLYGSTNSLGEPLQAWKLMLNPPAWSLSVELMFYLIAPFLVRKPIKFVVMMIFASIILRIFLIKKFGLGYDPWSSRFFPTELSAFLLGTCAYHFYKLKIKQDWIKGKEKLLVLLAILLMVGLPFVSVFHHLFYPFVMMSIIPFVFAATKSNVKDRKLGELSFPVYICHWPLVSTIRNIDSSVMPDYAKLIIAFSGTLLLAVVLYKFVDEPIERIRQALAKKAIEAPSQV